MPACPEGNELGRVAHLGLAFEVFFLQTSHVNQHLLWRRFAGQGRNSRFTGECCRVRFYSIGHGSTFQISVAY